MYGDAWHIFLASNTASDSQNLVLIKCPLRRTLYFHKYFGRHSLTRISGFHIGAKTGGAYTTESCECFSNHSASSRVYLNRLLSWGLVTKKKFLTFNLNSILAIIFHINLRPLVNQPQESNQSVYSAPSHQLPNRSIAFSSTFVNSYWGQH